MLPEQMIANAIWTSLGLVALVAFYYIVFRPLMADGFRERVEKLRDRLVHLGDVGLVDRDPAYERLMLVMQTLIAHTEEVTFLRVLLASYVGRRFATQLAAIPSFEQLLAGTPDENARRRLAAIHEHVEMELVRHVLLSFLPGWIVLASSFPPFLGFQLVRAVRRQRVTLARTFERIVRRIGVEIPGPVRALEMQATLRAAQCAA